MCWRARPSATEHIDEVARCRVSARALVVLVSRLPDLTLTGGVAEKDLYCSGENAAEGLEHDMGLGTETRLAHVLKLKRSRAGTVQEAGSL